MRTKPTHPFWTFNLLLILLVIFLPQAARADSPFRVTDDQPTLNFPESITFRANIESSATITAVVLEYGTEMLTCGTVIAKAFPQFTSGKSTTAEWTWEMRQSGSLPPGTTIWWRWRYVDQSGQEGVSEQKTVTWLDSEHNWQTLTSGKLNLHWYRGDQAFAQSLVTTANTGLQRLQNDAGLRPNKPIHLYIYGSTNDLKDAILFEPSWTGGLAYPEHDIVIIGIAPSELDWGRDAIVHELTHVLVGHLTFSCLGDVPTWLNEGLAVYAEGKLDPDSENQLNDAIQNDTLLSVRSLSAGFSEVPSKAYLSYSQSYSIVKYLIETYGQDKMNTLLEALRNGDTIDEALLTGYGFDVEGLEDGWRAAIGAKPRPASAQPTAQPTPTFVPTIVPYSGVPLAVTPTPYAVHTSTLGEPTEPTSNAPFIGLTVILVAICCIMILLLGVVVLGIFLNAEKRKGNLQ